MNAPLTAQQQEHAYLARLGERVRTWRTEHGMSRKALAEASGVSERYLAQLEAGQGNISVLLLRKVARAPGGAAAGPGRGQPPPANTTHPPPPRPPPPAHPPAPAARH